MTAITAPNPTARVNRLSIATRAVEAPTTTYEITPPDPSELAARGLPSAVRAAETATADVMTADETRAFISTLPALSIGTTVQTVRNGDAADFGAFYGAPALSSIGLPNSAPVVPAAPAVPALVWHSTPHVHGGPTVTHTATGRHGTVYIIDRLSDWREYGVLVNGIRQMQSAKPGVPRHMFVLKAAKAACDVIERARTAK